VAAADEMDVAAAVVVTGVVVVDDDDAEDMVADTRDVAEAWVEVGVVVNATADVEEDGDIHDEEGEADVDGKSEDVAAAGGSTDVVVAAAVVAADSRHDDDSTRLHHDPISHHREWFQFHGHPNWSETQWIRQASIIAVELVLAAASAPAFPAHIVGPAKGKVVEIAVAAEVDSGGDVDLEYVGSGHWATP